MNWIAIEEGLPDNLEIVIGWFRATGSIEMPGSFWHLWPEGSEEYQIDDLSFWMSIETPPDIKTKKMENNV